MLQLQPWCRINIPSENKWSLWAFKRTYWGIKVAAMNERLKAGRTCLVSSQDSGHVSTQNLIRWWSEAVDFNSSDCLNKRTKCQQAARKRRRSLVQSNMRQKFAKPSRSEECDRRHAFLKWVHLAGIISLELLNIFLYSSASKSQRNNIFQHNLKWCWRKKRRWQRSRGCQWLSYIAHALMDYLIISPSRRSALLMVGNMAFTSLKE